MCKRILSNDVITADVLSVGHILKYTACLQLSPLHALQPLSAKAKQRFAVWHGCGHLWFMRFSDGL